MINAEELTSTYRALRIYFYTDNLILTFFKYIKSLITSFIANYGVYVKALPTLDYDTTRQYDVTVRCTDSKDPVTGTFTVYISRNNPPVFVNLQGMHNSEKFNSQL